MLNPYQEEDQQGGHGKLGAKYENLTDPVTEAGIAVHLISVSYLFESTYDQY